MSSQTSPTPASRLVRRLGVAVLELGLLALVWWYLGIPDALAGALGVVVVVSGLLPEPWSGVVSGTGLLGVAAFAHLHYGLQKIPIILAAVGAVILLLALPRALRWASLRRGAGE